MLVNLFKHHWVKKYISLSGPSWHGWDGYRKPEWSLCQGFSLIFWIYFIDIFCIFHWYIWYISLIYFIDLFDIFNWYDLYLSSTYLIYFIDIFDGMGLARFLITWNLLAIHWLTGYLWRENGADRGLRRRTRTSKVQRVFFNFHIPSEINLQLLHSVWKLSKYLKACFCVHEKLLAWP